MSDAVLFDSNNTSLKPVLPKSKSHATRNKIVGRSQKPRPNQAEKMDQRSSRPSTSSEWKRVNGKPPVITPLMTDEKQHPSVLSSGMMFEGFKAGGSGSEALTEVGQASVASVDDQAALVPPGDAEMGCATSGVTCLEMQPQQQPCHERRPLVEISNGILPEDGKAISSRKPEKMEIPNGFLKRIDPSLRPTKGGKEEGEGGFDQWVDQSQKMEVYGYSWSEESAVPEAPMQLDKGEGKLRLEFAEVTKLEEEFWAMKALILWLVEGDRNTSFYHTSALVRRKRNRILCLKDRMGNWLNGEREIADFIRQGFSDLFTSEHFSAPLAEWDPPAWNNHLSEDALILLDAPLTDKEIFEDGSSLGNPGLAGSEGLIRNEKGDWVKGFAFAIGTTTSVAAELWALRDGIRLCIALKLQAVVIELDSKIVIDLLKKELNNPNALDILVSDCRNSLRNIPTVRIQHCYREGNKCADALARWGVSLSQNFSIFLDPPSDVALLLSLDAAGTLYDRVVSSVLEAG
nr:putative ribonuclease h protein [Quercus suber]